MRKWFVRAAVGVMGAVWLAGSSALAANPAPSGPPGQGLEISPPVMELSADPNQTVTATVRVRNVTQGALIVHGTMDDFGAGSDESGSPHLLLNETGANRYSLKYWVSGVPNLTLAPGELKTTTVAIHVPTNAEPGGHYGVVRFTGVPPNLDGTGVALSASVGTLVLLRVSGDVKDSLSVAQFASGFALSVDKWTSQSFFEHGPVGFLVRLHNDGTVHEKASGSITVKNVFGKKVGVIQVNPTGGNVLPDSYRRFTQSLSKKQLFGYYTANLALTYAGNKSLSAKLSFWVIPWKLILVVLIGLIVVFFLLRLAMRKYNNYIISQARKRR